ncbi:FMN-binding negative transcriptional regulator [Chelatococcus composti]|jgi:transcriptional regulator|uniref:Transcriptional regulator n=1 Tax=Chelatococcus composti TaxID=1743235 RepID=A0A841K6W1_9HYPH|nr:FMN-binding negative transcriptional regulator [Chelatococcus composti]MBB6168247.1 transcriptional regulator [Chelatococcus composti]MBS7736668.1 FMN-binding negative transcriptional regulator [Chelatococcus composti]PZN45307.1 MAG: transcriptional regulator [Pseudomonadota bacterium]GGG38602.1 transcriptional regulator [Chelatococcus composti]
MYQPPHFREERLEIQHALIRAHPLGLLISSGEDGLLANPVPFLLDAAAAPKGVLRAHLARANRQWQALAAGQPALVVFQGVDTYITPSWYETKKETGKVVPTWNYAIVQVRGPVRVVEDREWLRRQITALTAEHESSRSEPWAVTDAPEDFVEAQLKGIIGIEMTIETIEGKWKVSQNRPLADRIGVTAGLAAEADPRAAEMERLVRAYGGIPGP